MTYTYFASDGEMVKIGRSRNPYARLEMLRTSNPKGIELLAVMEGNQEPHLHAWFSHLRKSREWFILNDEMRTFIGRLPPVEVKPHIGGDNPTCTVSARMDPELIQKVHALCKDEDLTMAQAMRAGLRLLVKHGYEASL